MKLQHDLNVKIDGLIQAVHVAVPDQRRSCSTVLIYMPLDFLP
jgi:hypothetical protein